MDILKVNGLHSLHIMFYIMLIVGGTGYFLDEFLKELVVCCSKNNYAGYEILKK